MHESSFFSKSNFYSIQLFIFLFNLPIFYPLQHKVSCLIQKFKIYHWCSSSDKKYCALMDGKLGCPRKMKNCFEKNLPLTLLSKWIPQSKNKGILKKSIKFCRLNLNDHLKTFQFHPMQCHMGIWCVRITSRMLHLPHNYLLNCFILFSLQRWLRLFSNYLKNNHEFVKWT